MLKQESKNEVSDIQDYLDMNYKMRNELRHVFGF